MSVLLIAGSPANPSRSAALLDAVEQRLKLRAIVVATPVYKAAYSGVLKAFLDLLPTPCRHCHALGRERQDLDCRSLESGPLGCRPLCAGVFLAGAM